MDQETRGAIREIREWQRAHDVSCNARGMTVLILLLGIIGFLFIRWMDAPRQIVPPPAIWFEEQRK